MRKDSALEQKITGLFEEVKTTQFRPPINGPDIYWEDLEPEKVTAFLNWLNLRVGINAPFLLSISTEEDMEKNARGLFVHEFDHYRFHPYDMAMHLFLSYNAKKEFEELAEEIYALFTDFQDNILTVDNDFNREDLKSMLRSAWDRAGISSRASMAAVYSAYNGLITLGADIGIENFDKKKQEKILAASGELKNIIIRRVDEKKEYMLQYSQLRRFGHALKPLLEDELEESIASICFLARLRKGANVLITPGLVEGLPAEARGNLEQELRELIKELPPYLYQEMKRYLFGNDAANGKEDVLQSHGIGSEALDEMVADREVALFYMEAAREYGICVRPKRTMSISSVEIPFGKKDFKPVDSPIGIDLRFSGGRILPGLAKTTRTESIPYPASRDVIPGLLLYKDASGSMPDPRDLKMKCFATISGGMFIESYRKSGAEVGIVIFDAESGDIFFSRNPLELFIKLCSYKGGGTELDIERLENDLKEKGESLPLDIKLNQEQLKKHPLFRKYVLKGARITGLDRIKSKQPTDFVIITDGAIANISEVVSFFRENPEYRPTVLHTGNYRLDIEGYDGRTSGVYEGVMILRAETREDLVAMAKATIRQNLLSPFYVK